MFRRKKKDISDASLVLVFFDIDGERVDATELFKRINITVLDETRIATTFKLSTEEAKQLVDRLSIFDV